MTAERAVMLVKKVTYFWEFGHLNSSFIRKKYYFNVSRKIYLNVCSNTTVLFLLVSGRHVDAPLDGHQLAWRLHANLYKFG